MRLLGMFLLVVGSVYTNDDDKKENVGTVVGIDLGTTYSWWACSAFLISVYKHSFSWSYELYLNLVCFYLVLECSRMAVLRSSLMTRVTASLHPMWPSPERVSVWLEMQPRTSSPPTLKTRSLTPRGWSGEHGATPLCSRTSNTCLSRCVFMLVFHAIGCRNVVEKSDMWLTFLFEQF